MSDKESVKKIQPAELTWDEQGQPRSTRFEDLYFSSENGLEETGYVFLSGNNLEQRWANLKDNQHFVICETGFGSGLNLLAASELWLNIAPKTAHLHFISTELYPMRREDLKRTLAHWPELAALATALIENYPALTPGFHRFELNSQISVTLIFDDVLNGLTSLCPTLATELWDYKNWQVDAWFLDGFAPSQNPEMWSEQLFALMNRLSSDDASIATFTCAGIAKRGLKKWGFDIEKIPGYGRKREMLIAQRNIQLAVNLESQEQKYRTTSPCWHLDATQPEKPKHVAIIGAGIAGCSTAEALSRRNILSTVIDSHPDVALGASGNPQAALYARLSPDTGDLEDFCLHVINYAKRYYSTRITDRQVGDLTGLIQLPKSEKEQAKMLKMSERFSDAPELVQYLDSTQLSKLAGIEIDSEGLYFPNSGWINGQGFNRQLLKESGARFIPNTTVTSITATSIEDHQGQFTLSADTSSESGRTIGTFDAVVLCTAMGTTFHQPASWLPIRPIRGQVSFLGNQPETAELKTVLCKETYLTPAHEGKQSVGATYDLDTDNSELKAEDHLTNLEELKKLLASNIPFKNGTQLKINNESLQGRAGTRTTTPDYLPIVGTLPDIDTFEEQFSNWRKDRKRPISTAHNAHSGLYLNLGYGSRGYVYAPLCAELIAARIAKEPEPVSIEMQQSLHPARFLVRSLSRNKPLKDKS